MEYILNFFDLSIVPAQSSGAVEYADCIFVERDHLSLKCVLFKARK